MGTKHTPGPWKLERHGKGHGYDVVGGGPEPETVVYDVRNTRHEQALANARLIAAAPDLLAALKDVLFATKGSSGILDRAREAVAKAEGSR